MKIVIASMGRAHLLDTARELAMQGHEVKFYSYTKKENFKKFQLPINVGVSLTYIVAPLIALTRFFPSELTRALLRNGMDYLVKRLMPPCDIFICQSPNFINSMQFAKKKFGAKILVDRGSSHIYKMNSLRQTYSNSQFPRFYIDLEVRQYKLADSIVVGSQYVAETFKEQDFPIQKLFINNYGVNLDHFKPTKLEQPSHDLIMVGTWSRRKGCDILTHFCDRYNYKIIHIGSDGDTPYPKSSNFTHIDPVPEYELINYYRKAKVFILLSKDEGLALVQAQAITCGLPLVISTNTGGHDFYQHLQSREWIKEIKINDLDDLEKIKQKVESAIELANTQINERCYCTNLEEKISWKAYGERYHKFLQSIH